MNTLPIFLLRQVNNFSIAAPTQAIANLLFDKIQIGLNQSLKLSGILTIFNSYDM